MVGCQESHCHASGRELYDRQTDPQENQNIAGKPENVALIERLAAELAASRAARKAQ